MKENNFYNIVGQYYDEEASEFDKRYWKNPGLQQIRQAFREEVKRHHFHNMLEVGFGTGIDLIHFAKTNPEARILGIDVSGEMLAVSHKKIKHCKLDNIEVQQSTVENLVHIHEKELFDMIYVFFGALNTTDSLEQNARILSSRLSPNGTMVLSFVNKWYLGGIFLEFVRLRFRKAFARLKPIWGGYSPLKHLPSRCYSPREIKKAFKPLIITRRIGFSILHPAWYYTGINSKIQRISPLLWKIDRKLNSSFMWRFGEYTLLTFKHPDNIAQH